MDCITFAYPFTSSLHFSVSFQTLFECGTQPMAEYALKPLCNAETVRDCLFERQTVLPDDYSALGLHCLVHAKK